MIFQIKNLHFKIKIVISVRRFNWKEPWDFLSLQYKQKSLNPKLKNTLP